MTQDTTTTSGAAIQRYKIGYHADEWGQRSSTPSGIPDASGSWVRYADHVNALAAGQATAAQQGAAYADAHGAIMGAAYDFRDAHISGSPNQKRSAHAALESAVTHTLRASHGQAPTDAKALAEADRRAGEAERLLATCKEDVMRFEQVRSRMKYQWGAEQRVSFDEVWDEALALKKAAQAAPQADSVLEDAARYRLLRRGQHWTVVDGTGDYLRAEALDAAVDAARKQGANHD